MRWFPLAERLRYGGATLCWGRGSGFVALEARMLNQKTLGKPYAGGPQQLKAKSARTV